MDQLDTVRVAQFRQVMRGVNPTTLTRAIHRLGTGVDFTGTTKTRLLGYFTSNNFYPHLRRMTPAELQASIEWIKRVQHRSK